MKKCFLPICFTLVVFLLVWWILLFICLCHDILLKPKVIRSKLRRQGIRGPTSSFVMGNIPEMKWTMSMVDAACSETPPPLDFSSFTVFPYFNQWTSKYGITVLIWSRFMLYNMWLHPWNSHFVYNAKLQLLKKYQWSS